MKWTEEKVAAELAKVLKKAGAPTIPPSKKTDSYGEPLSCWEAASAAERKKAAKAAPKMIAWLKEHYEELKESGISNMWPIVRLLNGKHRIPLHASDLGAKPIVRPVRGSATDHSKVVNHERVHQLAQHPDAADLTELVQVWEAYAPEATTWTELKHANPDLYADLVKIGRCLVRHAKLRPAALEEAMARVVEGSGGNVQRALQTQMVLRGLEDAFARLAPEVKWRPSVDIVYAQDKPIRIIVDPKAGSPEAPMVTLKILDTVELNDCVYSGGIEAYQPKLDAVVRKLKELYQKKGPSHG